MHILLHILFYYLSSNLLRDRACSLKNPMNLYVPILPSSRLQKTIRIQATILQTAICVCSRLQKSPYSCIASGSDRIPAPKGTTARYKLPNLQAQMVLESF